MEFGLISFADMQPDSGPAQGARAGQRLHDLLEEIQLADQLGLDVYGVGEHHRPDYAVSAPAVVLAAAAALTKKIRLSSAVSVLSSADPVRVFQEFATLDLLSGGRAEIMAGRGSFTESFPLFGYDLKDYNELFAEKLELLLKLRQEEQLSWQGQHRAPIHNRGVYPRPFQQALPVWIAAGGTPASAVRAARLGLPLMLAIIGGSADHFVSFIQLYRRSAEEAGTTALARVGINHHMYVAEDSRQAADEFFPHYASVMNRIGRERGWGPVSREQFEYMRGPQGALMVGSVQEVTEKILEDHERFGFHRFMAQASVGPVPHQKTLRSIELFGSKVVPAVKKSLGV